MRLWLVQSVTALVLAMGLAVHLVAIPIAARGGLSAAEIIGRGRGFDAAWLALGGLTALCGIPAAAWLYAA